MSRDEAVEAAARAIQQWGGIDWESASGHARKQSRSRARVAVAAARPVIERELLDRIEEAVKVRIEDITLFPSERREYQQGVKDGWEEVLTILTEIREGGKP